MMVRLEYKHERIADDCEASESFSVVVPELQDGFLDFPLLRCPWCNVEPMLVSKWAHQEVPAVVVDDRPTFSWTYQEAPAPSEGKVAQPSPLSELEEADKILMQVLSIRAYGENGDETWENAERMIEEFLRRDRCTQCGMRFSHRACGPTHAMLSEERAARENEKLR